MLCCMEEGLGRLKATCTDLIRASPNLSASLNITNSTIDIVLRIRAEMLNKSIDFICLFVILFRLGEAFKVKSGVILVK